MNNGDRVKCLSYGILYDYHNARVSVSCSTIKSLYNCTFRISRIKHIISVWSGKMSRHNRYCPRNPHDYGRIGNFWLALKHTAIDIHPHQLKNNSSPFETFFFNYFNSNVLNVYIFELLCGLRAIIIVGFEARNV